MGVEIRNDICILRLLSRRNLDPKAEVNYLKGIAHFCSFAGLSPSEVVERATELGEEKLVEWFREFFIAKKDVLAPIPLSNFTMGVKALLIENSVRSVGRVSRGIAREFKRAVGFGKTLLKKDVITKEGIIQVLRGAPLKGRAIIALMESSGLRVRAAG